MASSPPQRPHQRFPAGVCTANHVRVALLHWLRRSLQVIALAGVAVLCCAVASLPASPPLRDRSDRQVLRIVVANLFYANPGRHELARQLVGVEPDIVAVIECTHQNVALEDFRRLGYRVLHAEQSDSVVGMCLFAKGSISAEAALVPTPVAGPCAIPHAAIRVRHGAGWLSAVVIHVPPPVPSCRETTDATVRAVASWVDEERLVRDLGLARAGDPVVLLGDFNALPWWDSIRELEEVGLFDAWSVSRIRPGPTGSPWSWLPSLARIDYVFAPASLPIDGIWTISIPGSDHRGVVADLRLDVRG